MPKRLRIYAYEGHQESIINELLRIKVPGGAGSAGQREPLKQQLLEDPRWRREYLFTLPDDVDTMNVLTAIEHDDRIEVLEDSDA